jgi:hypothetical protein
MVVVVCLEIVASISEAGGFDADEMVDAGAPILV